MTHTKTTPISQQFSAATFAVYQMATGFYITAKMKLIPAGVVMELRLIESWLNAAPSGTVIGDGVIWWLNCQLVKAEKLRDDRLRANSLG